MPPRMPHPGPETAAASVERLATKAMADLDKVTGSRPATRPAHLAQLAAVLLAGVQQARQAEAGSSSVDRDSDLWRLREPGYLRGIGEHPVDRPGGTLPLVPVLLTWAVLGYAEWNYVQEFSAADAGTRPSFFADWMAQPWYHGPVALSIAIVLTVLLIIVRHRGPDRAQRRADEVDRIVHRLEVDLLPPLTVLRGSLGPVQVEEHMRQAAVELAVAARLFTTATGRLAESTAVVDRLVSGVERLVGALPELGEQTAKLDEVRAGLDRTAHVITTQLDPFAAVVADVGGAAEAARAAVDRSEEVLRRASGRLDEARDLTDRSATHREALEAAQQPFSAVADVVAGAAGKLDSTSALLHQTVSELRTTLAEVNWLAMVSDGLRDPHAEHDGTIA